jgi:hypothetical protein
VVLFETVVDQYDRSAGAFEAAGRIALVLYRDLSDNMLQENDGFGFQQL